jgi:hypothetical protein
VKKDCAQNRTLGFQVVRERAFGNGDVGHRLKK